MATTAKKKESTNIGGQDVPNDMLANPTSVASTALAVNEEKLVAEIKQLSNSMETSTKNFPLLKLQHTTTRDGEPNPLRGHYALVKMNDLGQWETKDLGETVKFQFLLRRYFLSMNKGDDTYTSAEFDSPMEIVPLWKRRGDQSEIFGEGTPHDLQSKFLKKDEKNRVRSDLRLLSKLYLLIDGELVAWKLSMTGTIAWSKYSKMVPFTAGVVTLAGRTEEKNGTVKYYAPVFKAEERLADLAEVKANIELLRDMLPKRNQDSFVMENETDDLPFK